MKRKHIILAKLFEFGGSNTHLGTMITYFGGENVILVLEDPGQRIFLKNITGGERVKVLILPGLHKFAHLAYPAVLTNLRELLKVLLSLLKVAGLIIRYRAAGLSVCVVEPEKFLYLFWVPFAKVFYILHTAPHKKHTAFTSVTGNVRLGKSKKIITVSEANKKLICDNWDISGRKQVFISVVYNCVTEAQLANGPVHKEAIDDVLIVTSGHVVEYKNPALWLKVAQRLTATHSRLRFVWLGNGPLLADLENAAKGNGRIVFEGKVGDVSAYLDKAAIYYQPSSYETHGIAVLEAMAKALPCVVSNTGGLPESITHRHNGLLVDPVNLEEHVSALSYLAENPELRREFGMKAYQKCAGSFSFTAFKNQMDAIYFNKGQRQA